MYLVFLTDGFSIYFMRRWNIYLLWKLHIPNQSTSIHIPVTILCYQLYYWGDALNIFWLRMRMRFNRQEIRRSLCHHTVSTRCKTVNTVKHVRQMNELFVQERVQESMSLAQFLQWFYIIIYFRQGFLQFFSLLSSGLFKFSIPIDCISR